MSVPPMCRITGKGGLGDSEEAPVLGWEEKMVGSVIMLVSELDFVLRWCMEHDIREPLEHGDFEFACAQLHPQEMLGESRKLQWLTNTHTSDIYRQPQSPYFLTTYHVWNCATVFIMFLLLCVTGKGSECCSHSPISPSSGVLIAKHVTLQQNWLYFPYYYIFRILYFVRESTIGSINR